MHSITLVMYLKNDYEYTPIYDGNYRLTWIHTQTYTHTHDISVLTWRYINIT